MLKNINPREKAEKRQKIKDIIFKVVHGISYVCTGLFVAVCIVACATQNKSKASADNSSVVIERVESPKYKIDTSDSTSEELPPLTYDDELLEITIPQDYLENNYEFINFEEFVSTINPLNPPYRPCSIDYDGNIYDTFAINPDHGYVWTYDGADDSYNIYIEDGIFSSNYDESWITEFYLKFSSSELYESGKSALQLDVSSDDTIDVGIFEGLTTSITSFISTLNVGLTAIIGIFWNSSTSALTPLGILSTLVVGVALVYFIFRLVIGLIRLRG